MRRLSSLDPRCRPHAAFLAPGAVAFQQPENAGKCFTTATGLEPCEHRLHSALQVRPGGQAGGGQRAARHAASGGGRGVGGLGGQRHEARGHRHDCSGASRCIKTSNVHIWTHGRCSLCKSIVKYRRSACSAAAYIVHSSATAGFGMSLLQVSPPRQPATFSRQLEAVPRSRTPSSRHPQPRRRWASHSARCSRPCKCPTVF